MNAEREAIERWLLGAFLLSPEVFDSISQSSQRLGSGCFQSERHQLVFEAIQGLRARKQPVDVVIVRDALVASGLDWPECVSDLVWMQADCPTIHNASDYLAVLNGEHR